MSQRNFLHMYCGTNINNSCISTRHQSGHVTCQHAFLMSKTQSTVGQKECPFHCIRFYWAEGNWNCNSLCSFHHTLCNISSRSRPCKVPLPLRISIWHFVRISNFSSTFLLSHLSHCLSAHHPPPFNHQYKPCSPSLFIPPLLPLSSDQISSSATVITQYFRV